MGRMKANELAVYIHLPCADFRTDSKELALTFTTEWVSLSVRQLQRIRHPLKVRDGYKTVPYIKGKMGDYYILISGRHLRDREGQFLNTKKTIGWQEPVYTAVAMTAVTVAVSMKVSDGVIVDAFVKKYRKKSGKKSDRERGEAAQSALPPPPLSDEEALDYLNGEIALSNDTVSTRW